MCDTEHICGPKSKFLKKNFHWLLWIWNKWMFSVFVCLCVVIDIRVRKGFQWVLGHRYTCTERIPVGIRFTGCEVLGHRYTCTERIPVSLRSSIYVYGKDSSGDSFHWIANCCMQNLLKNPGWVYSICLSVYDSVWLCVCVSLFLWLFVSVSLSVYLSLLNDESLFITLFKRPSVPVLTTLLLWQGCFCVSVWVDLFDCCLAVCVCVQLPHQPINDG